MRRTFEALFEFVESVGLWEWIVTAVAIAMFCVAVGYAF